MGIIKTWATHIQWRIKFPFSCKTQKVQNKQGVYKQSKRSGYEFETRAVPFPRDIDFD